VAEVEQIQHVVTDEVDCPWCGAEAGQGCYIQDDSLTGWHRGDRQQIHLARTKELTRG
jgi:hypothetical protein